MKNISIDSNMKSIWRYTRVGCLQYKVDVQNTNDDMWKYFKSEILKRVKNTIFDYDINDIPNIKESREAYKAFGKDPSRYRVSSEALYRRIAKGQGLYKVNTVVDINNMISLKSGFSVGSYDISNLNGDLILRIGKESEAYKGIGKEEINIEGLPVISDKEGAVGSSTSDSRRAMITENTKEVLTLIYSFSNNQDLEQALKYGKDYLEKYADAKKVESIICQ
ncbi:MAG: B3/4 domain-containing protein [Suipraeoptans sp.]